MPTPPAQMDGRCEKMCVFFFVLLARVLLTIFAVLAQFTDTPIVSSLTPVQRRLLIAMGSRFSCQKRRCDAKVNAKVNATVVVNIFTLEVAVEDVNTDGEKKGLKTAHETLLDHAGWTRPYCHGGAVQQGNFRPVSGFLNGLREGYKAVAAPGYDGQLTAFGPVVDTTSKAFNAFRKFTKQNENREKAQIPAEAVRVALSLAANGEDGFKKGSFSMHPMLHARSLEYLSSFEGGMEDPDANQQMLLKVLVIKEEHYGEHHPEVAGTLNNLADAYMKLGDYRTQKELLERALKIKENDYFQIFMGKFGINPRDIGATLTNLGLAYNYLGDYGKDKEVYERALEIQERHHGKDHFVVACTLNNLGLAYYHLKDYEKAIEVYERALKKKEQHYTKDHFEVAITLGNLGLTYIEIKDYEKAKEFLERALEIKERHFGKDHFEVAITLVNLALTHGCLGDQKRQVELLRRVLPIFQNHYGVHSDHCAVVRRSLDEATGSKQCARRRVVTGLQLLLRPRTDSGL